MKAKNYLLTVILTLSFLGLNAQEGSIIHHEPDTCFIFHGFGYLVAFDIDGNGTDDLAFQACEGQMHSTWLNAVVFDDWQMTMEDPAYPYPDSTQLDTLSYWNGTSLFIPIINLSASPSVSVITTKICLRNKVGDDYYYAWVKTDGGWNERRVYACVEEFAYCSIPDYPLRWGQTTMTGIVESNESNSFASIHPNPTTGMVVIAGENLHQAEVFNTLGQQVLSVQGSGNELYINMSAFPAGIYFVAVTNEEGRKCVQKVVRDRDL